MLDRRRLRRRAGSGSGSPARALRPPDPGRPAAPDLLRQLRAVAVRVPVERRRGRAGPRRPTGDPGGRQRCSSRSRPGPRRRGRRPDLVRRQALGPAPQGAARPHRARASSAGLAATGSASSGRACPAGSIEGLRQARPGLELVDLDPVIRPLRRAKDPDEIALIRRSIRAGEAGHAAALARVEPGMTELDVFLLVQQAATRAAGEPVIVYGDFASGPRCETERGGPPDLAEDRARATCSCSTSRSIVTATGATSPTRSPSAPSRPPASASCSRPASRRSRPASGSSGRAPARAVDAGRARAISPTLGLGRTPSPQPHRPRPRPRPPRAALLRPRERRHARGRRRRRLEPGLYIAGVGGMRFERNYLITADGFETLTRPPAHARTLRRDGSAEPRTRDRTLARDSGPAVA